MRWRYAEVVVARAADFVSVRDGSEVCLVDEAVNRYLSRAGHVDVGPFLLGLEYPTPIVLLNYSVVNTH